jgi:hypothetical protein
MLATPFVNESVPAPLAQLRDDKRAPADSLEPPPGDQPSVCLVQAWPNHSHELINLGASLEASRLLVKGSPIVRGKLPALSVCRACATSPDHRAQQQNFATEQTNHPAGRKTDGHCPGRDKFGNYSLAVAVAMTREISIAMKVMTIDIKRCSRPRQRFIGSSSLRCCGRALRSAQRPAPNCVSWLR